MATTATRKVASVCPANGVCPQEPRVFFNFTTLDTDVFSWDVSVTSLLFRMKGWQMSEEIHYGLCYWRIIFVYERKQVCVYIQRKKVDEGPEYIRLNFTVEFTVHTRQVVHNNRFLSRQGDRYPCFNLHRGHLPKNDGSHGLGNMITFTCRFLDWKEEILPKMHTDEAQEEDAGSEEYDDYDEDFQEAMKRMHKSRSKQKGISALTSDFEQLLSSGYESDVVLKVQDKEFPVHRFVLGTRSPVLRATLSHDPEEEKTAVVKIPDCDPESFSDFLSFLYSGSVGELTVDTALQLYATSDKYDVRALKSICHQHLKDNLTPESVCDVAVLADQHSDDDLSSAVQRCFNRHYDSILQTSEWTEMLKNNPHVSDKMLKAKAKQKKCSIPTVYL